MIIIVPYLIFGVVLEIIGRKEEQSFLLKKLKSNESELIAVYGRRRVGKTYLIRNFFEQQKGVFFQVSGIHNSEMSVQISEFCREIERVFFASTPGLSLTTPKTWLDAFNMLTDAMKLRGGSEKTVLFFDEFPWLASPRSGFLQAFDYYWNRFWINNKNIKIIICGSAASWIINKVLNNKAGLHNRVTGQIHLKPFNLAETKSYLGKNGLTLENNQVLELYMCLGGIPYYLRLMESNLSIVQNINKHCFQRNGFLYNEFQNLFASLFDDSQMHESIVRIIAEKKGGCARADIEERIKVKGGRLSIWLTELEQAGFLRSFVPWGRERGLIYQVVDEYTLFYLTWIEPLCKNRLDYDLNANFWASIYQTQPWNIWSGYAFEAVCSKHLGKIQARLNIPNGSQAASWVYKSQSKEDSGAQIDLVFDRPDNSVTLCEIKYRTDSFVVDKAYAANLMNKISVYRKITKTKKQVFVSIIVSSVLKDNAYSDDLVSSKMELSDFF